MAKLFSDWRINVNGVDQAVVVSNAESFGHAKEIGYIKPVNGNWLTALKAYAFNIDFKDYTIEQTILQQAAQVWTESQDYYGISNPSCLPLTREKFDRNNADHENVPAYVLPLPGQMVEVPLDQDRSSARIPLSKMFSQPKAGNNIKNDERQPLLDHEKSPGCCGKLFACFGSRS